MDYTVQGILQSRILDSVQFRSVNPEDFPNPGLEPGFDTYTDSAIIFMKKRHLHISGPACKCKEKFVKINSHFLTVPLRRGM